MSGSYTIIVCVCVCSFTYLCQTPCNPMDYSPPGSSVHEISRQEYWHGLPLPSPGALPDSGCLLHWQADSLLLYHLGSSYTIITSWSRGCLCVWCYAKNLLFTKYHGKL